MKNYEPGQPKSTLYIKNLAPKKAKKEDLEYLFGRYFHTKRYLIIFDKGYYKLLLVLNMFYTFKPNGYTITPKRTSICDISKCGDGDSSFK